MKYELVNFAYDLPVKIILHSVESHHQVIIPRHWHESIEISYVLSGTIDSIYIEGSTYRAEAGDITIINSNEVHSFLVHPQENGSALTVLIDYHFLKQSCPDIDRMAFRCLPREAADASLQSKFSHLRYILKALAEMGKMENEDSLASVRINGLAYELAYVLLRDFAVEKRQAGTIKSEKHLELLTNITEFIKTRYDQQLSIKSIACHFGFAPTYLCRFFRKHIGMTILQYINTIRLENAHRQLVQTDQFIAKIAQENGFPNTKSFNRVFKDLYKLSPDQYRKGKRSESQGEMLNNAEKVNNRRYFG